MKTTIEVQSKKEGELIKAGLEDASVRAFVQIVGALQTVSERARIRILRFVQDSLEEGAENGK